ncbi:MAG: hypothetical protein M1514_03855 [Patescibacteria group bacterium]|nr:hypothetical protein [Patescibacteria group bacterium]
MTEEIQEVQSPQEVINPHQKSISKLVLLVVLLLILVTGLIFGAYTLGKKQGKALVVTQQPEVTQTSVDETANWQTYTNEKYSIEYPSNWFVYDYKDKNLCVNISDVSNPVDIPSKLEADGHTVILMCFYSSAMPKSFPYTNGSNKNTTVKPYEINGYSGIRGKETSTLGEGETVFLQNPQGGYVTLRLETGDTKIFDQILSTFKFTSQGVSSSPKASDNSTALPQTKITPPASFGYTKLIDLPGIGVRALFPPEVEITYSNPQESYFVNKPQKTDWNCLSFNLKGYYSGGRREWFNNNYYVMNPIFEPFSASSHNGYIVYTKNANGSIADNFDFYYISAIGTQKMLVVSGSNSNEKLCEDLDFQKNLDKFRSFVSGIQIIFPNSQGVSRSDQSQIGADLVRYAEKRVNLWENVELGLRITGPEWIESRIFTKINEDGTKEYSPWSKKTLKAEKVESSTKGETWDVGTGILFDYEWLSLLDSKYNDKSFDEVNREVLPGTGFCGEDWKNDKADCSFSEYCYTKNDVINNGQIVKTTNFGPYSGQLRGLKTGFELKMDCRGSNEWLIKAKGGRYVLSTITPDGNLVRLEGF